MSRARFDLADLVSLTLAAMIVAGTLAAPRLADSGYLPEDRACWSRSLLDVECPGCGMTRSVIALGRGELERALELNWIAPTILGLALLHLGARALKGLRPALTLRRFDLATLGVVILIHLVRAAQVWLF